MGAFFTNVQVKVGDRSPEAVRSKVLETLRKWSIDNGFEPLDPGRTEEAGEFLRTILVTIADSRQWISVYDELTETQHDDLLKELCTVLSQNTQSAVVGILVHDSDMLALVLADNGTIVDEYVSMPDYFGSVTAEEKLAYAGRPELWRDLLTSGVTPEDLRTVWDTNRVFAEEILKDFAKAVGIPSFQSTVGFNYLTMPDLEIQDRPPTVELRFRWTRPVSEEPANAALTLAGNRLSRYPEAEGVVEEWEAKFKQYTPTEVAVSLKNQMKAQFS